VRSVVVEPRSVVIQGLKNEVRKTNELKTEALDISGLNGTTTQELNLDTSGINVKTEVNAVKVTVEIAGRKR